MKKLKTFFAAAALLLATSAFASPDPDNVSEKVKKEFEKNFTGAQQVNWKKIDDFYFAFFKLNESEVTAAYNEGGEMLGISRIINIKQLPLNVTLAITAKYAGYTFAKNATELNFEGQTSYYVNIENSKKNIKLKCTSYGEIYVDSKTKK